MIFFVNKYFFADKSIIKMVKRNCTFKYFSEEFSDNASKESSYRFLIAFVPCSNYSPTRIYKTLFE